MSRKNAVKNSYAVITGASSGIGAEFARALAGEGYHLILAARRTERLEQLAEEIRDTIAPAADIQIISADLEQRSECTRFMNELDAYPITVFINNAGFGDCGYFPNTDLEKELSMIDLNVTAVHILTKLVVKRFEAQHGGYLLNVASSAGLIPAGPYMATYYATKSYVASLSRAVNMELREKKSNVYVGALCPGPVDTEFNSRANVQFSLRGITARQCVREAVRGMKRRQAVIIPSAEMKAAIILGRHIPQNIYIKLTGKQQKKKFSE